MKRTILKQILLKHYSKDSVKSLLCGRMKPSSKMMFNLNKENNIPFTAWENIKSFISESVSNEENKK